MQNQQPKYGNTIYSGDSSATGQDQIQGEFTVFSSSEQTQQTSFGSNEEVSSVSATQVNNFVSDQAEMAIQDESLMVAFQQPPMKETQQYQQLEPQGVAVVAATSVYQQTQNTQQPQNTSNTEVEAAEPQQDSANASEQLTGRSESFAVDEIRLRPSASLLIFRLLGAGLVILLILFFLALTVDIIRFAFGDQALTLLNSRMFTFTLGIIIYMVVGLVIYEQWSHTLYTLTTEKLVVDRGWIFKNRQSRDMVQFGGVQVNQGLIGKIFNYGDLRMEYHGAIGKVAGETLHDIPDPFLHEQMLAKMFAAA